MWISLAVIVLVGGALIGVTGAVAFGLSIAGQLIRTMETLNW